MLQIPAQLANQFATYIVQQGVPAGQHRYYLKWIRYYLDFCHKYQFEQGTDMSLSAFLKKLNEKKQPAQLQKQARQAVQLYFACAQFSKKQQDFRNENRAPHSTNISPNTHRENLQEYRSLEVVAQQSKYPAGKKNTPQKGGGLTGRTYSQNYQMLSVFVIIHGQR